MERTTRGFAGRVLLYDWPQPRRPKRVAQRLGMSVLRHDELECQPHLVYALTR